LARTLLIEQAEKILWDSAAPYKKSQVAAQSTPSRASPHDFEKFDLQDRFLEKTGQGLRKTFRAVWPWLFMPAEKPAVKWSRRDQYG